MRNLVIISLCYLAVGVNADGWRRVLPLIPIDGPSPFKPSHLNTGESIESPPLVDVNKPADVKAPTQPVGPPMEHPGIVGVQSTVPPPPGVPSLPPVIAVQPTVPPPPGIPSFPPVIAVQPTVTPQPGNANQNQSKPAEVITSGQPVNINQLGSTAAAVQGTLTPEYVRTTGKGSPANAQGTTEEEIDLQSLPIFTYPDTSPNTGVVTAGQPQNIPTTGGQPITPPPVQPTSSPLTPQYVGTTGQGTPPSAQGTTEDEELLGLPIFTFPPETSLNKSVLISGQPQIVQTTGGQPIGTGQPGATTAPPTPGVQPSRTPGLISLIGQGTPTAAVEVTTAGPVVSAIVRNGITTIGQSIDQGPHTVTPAVVQLTTGPPISNVPNRGDALFVPSSAKQVGCLFPKDCYEFREPDDWCLLPPNSAYFDRGCFCDLATKSCIIERNVGNVKQWTHCTPKSESKCLKLFHVPLRFRRV